jgi:hypothetical protein
MIKAQLKSNFDPTFLLSLPKKLMWRRERAFNLERERGIWLKSWAKVGLKLCLYQTSFFYYYFFHPPTCLFLPCFSLPPRNHSLSPNNHNSRPILSLPLPSYPLFFPLQIFLPKNRHLPPPTSPKL